MAVVAAIGAPAGAINYTQITDTSADFASVANSTYFYNKADKLVRFKDSSGTVLEIFAAGGGGGLTIGTTAIASGAVGRVLFEGTGNVAQEDTAFFWDNTNKRLGVGTTTPLYPLDVKSTSGAVALNLQANSDSFRPGIRIEALRQTNSGIAFNFFDLNIGQSPTITNVGVFGLYGEVMNSPTPSYAKYIFMGANSTTAYDNAVFKIDADDKIGIGLSSVDRPTARLDIKAPGALSTDRGIRLRNSTDTFNSFAINGLGEIETRLTTANWSKTLVIGGNNVIAKGDFGGYNNGSVVGFDNTMNNNVNLYIFGNGNYNYNNGNGVILGYSNANASGFTLGAFNNFSTGITVGSSNSGCGYKFGNNNVVSEWNGYGDNAFVIGNYISVPNASSIYNTIFLGSRSSAGTAYASLHHSNFGIGEVVPTLASYDLAARGVFYTKVGTAPTTMAANTMALYTAAITAGNAVPHFRTENGTVIKLYKQDLPTNPTTAQIATFLSNLGLANLI